MKRILIFAALAALLASCSQDELQTPANKNLTPLGVSSASLAAVITKSGDFQNNSAIGVLLSGNGAYNYTALCSKYNYSDDTWSKDPSAGQIYLNNNPANIYAYYPYSDDINNSTNWTSIPLTSSIYADAKDLCYGSGVADDNNAQPISSQHASAKFQMNRAYSSITINLTKENYTGNGKVTVVSINNAFASGKIDLTTGTVSSQSNGIVPVFSTSDAAATIDATTGYSWHVLMVPATAANKVTPSISFTIDGVTLTTNSLNIDLVAGTNYKVSVKLSGHELAVSSVTLTPWTDASSVVNGGIIK